MSDAHDFSDPDPTWCKAHGSYACSDDVERALLRRVLSEYVAGNRIVDGYWYSPDECGAAHFRNDRATADEVALVESLRTEFGL